jgi:hypothetical protein
VSKSHFLLPLKRKVSSPARAQASTHHIMSLSCQFREGQPKNLHPINREREREVLFMSLTFTRVNEELIKKEEEEEEL